MVRGFRIKDQSYRVGFKSLEVGIEESGVIDEYIKGRDIFSQRVLLTKVFAVRENLLIWRFGDIRAIIK